jgi:hypothetical protein
MCFNKENVALIVEGRCQFEDMTTGFVNVIVIHNSCMWVYVVGRKSTHVFGSSKVETIVLEKVQSLEIYMGI